MKKDKAGHHKGHIKRVGKDGVVLMEESDTEDTHVEMVDGVQFDSGIESPHFITDKDKQRCVLENPYVLIQNIFIEYGNITFEMDGNNIYKSGTSSNILPPLKN